MRAVAGRGRAAPRAGSGGGKRGPGVRVGGDDRRAERVSQEVKGVVCVSVQGPFPGGRRSCLAGVAAVLIRRILLGGPAAVRRLACGWARRRPSAAHCGMRASSAPASRHKVAAFRASGSSCRPSTRPRRCRTPRPAGRSGLRQVHGVLSPRRVAHPGEVAPSSMVPGGSGELGDQEPVSSRHETILVHLARIERASGYLKQAGRTITAIAQ